MSAAIFAPALKSSSGAALFVTLRMNGRWGVSREKPSYKVTMPRGQYRYLVTAYKALRSTGRSVEEARFMLCNLAMFGRTSITTPEGVTS